MFVRIDTIRTVLSHLKTTSRLFVPFTTGNVKTDTSREILFAM